VSGDWLQVGAEICTLPAASLSSWQAGSKDSPS